MTNHADRPAPEGQPAQATPPVWVLLADYDVEQTLAAAGQAMADQHAAQLRALEVDVQFARLHSTDPAADRPKDARPRGAMTLAEWDAIGNHLVQVGGDGTPMVQELPICELAVARGVHVSTARAHLADALDLTHRLTRTFGGLREGRGAVWVARKVAAMSRRLDREQVRAVDDAVAAALDESPSRVLVIAQAAVRRADSDRARREVEDQLRRRMVSIAQPRGADDEGLATVFSRIDPGDATWLDAMVDRVADVLAERPDLTHGQEMGRDELRAEALGWLAHPADVVALLAGDYAPDAATEPAPGCPSTSRRSTRQRAVLHVHIAEAAVSGDVARVEELGPLLLDQVTRLLSHAHVEVKPVIDLNRNRSVNGYEHPADVAERGFLRTTGDVFPHATSQSRRVDSDHPTPYRSTGPPGQTGDHNQAPLGRRHHRAKTHLPYQVQQLGLGSYAWRTPHGLCRVVDGTGTHPIDGPTAWRLLNPGAARALDAAVDRLLELAPSEPVG